MCLVVQTTQGPPAEKKKREKENTKVYPKEAEEHFMAKNKHKILKCGQKRTLLGGPKDAKARKACQKAMMAFRRLVFVLTSPTKVQARIFPQNKGRGKDQKGNGKEGTFPQSGLSASLRNTQ